MEGLGHREKLGLAVDQPPLRRDTQGLQHRQMPGEQLGNAAAEGRGIYVADLDPFKVPGQGGDLIDQIIADERAIVLYVGG